MGYWNDMVINATGSAVKRRPGRPNPLMAPAQPNPAPVQPNPAQPGQNQPNDAEELGLDLQGLIQPDPRLEGYVRFRLPNRPIPNAEEQNRLNELRKKAFRNIVAGSRKRQECIAYANMYGEPKLNDLGEPVLDADGNIVRNSPFTTDDRTEVQDIPFMDSPEEVKRYIDNFYGFHADLHRPLNHLERKKLLLENFRTMIQKANRHPELLDVDQTDDYLAEHFMEMFSIVGPSIQEGNKITNIVEELEHAQPPQITPEEKQQFLALRDRTNEILQQYSILSSRINTILGPMYQYLGASNLSFDESSKLADLEDLPREFLTHPEDPECEDPLQGIYTANNDFHFSYILALNNSFRSSHPELFAGPVVGFSEETGDVDDKTIDTAKVVYLKGAGPVWRKFVRDDHGVFQEQNPPTPEENRVIQGKYDMMKDPANINLIRSLTPAYLNTADAQGKLIHAQIQNDPEEVWKQLFSSGHLFYRPEGTDEMHRLSLEGSRIVDTPLTLSQWLAERTRLGQAALTQAGVQNPSDAEGNIFECDRIVMGSSKSAIADVARELTDLLAGKTNYRGSSDAYRNVEQALKDYKKVHSSLNKEEHLLMLRKISDLAQVYLDGKTEADRRNNSYTAQRYDAMLQVQQTINRYREAWESLMQRNLVPSEIPGLDNLRDEYSECIERTLMNSMTGKPFDAETFVHWKAADGWNHRFPKIAELRESPAVKFMTENIQGNIRSEDELNRYYNAAAAGFEAMDRLHELSDAQFIEKYNAMLHNEVNEYKSGNAAYDAALHERLMTMINRAAMRRSLDIVPGREAPSGADHGAFSYEKRTRVLNTLTGSELRAYSRLAIGVVRTEGNSKQAFAHSIFGTDHETLQSVLPGNLVERGMPMTVVTCLLLDSQNPQFTIDEILDPNAKVNEKRAFGAQLMQELRGPANNGNNAQEIADHKKAIFSRISRSLAEHCEQIQNYGLELANARGIHQADKTLKYAETVRILQDGIFDAFCQSVVKTDIWDQNHREQTLATFRHENEQPEQTQERIEKLALKANMWHSQIMAKDAVLQKKGAIYNKLKDNADVDPNLISQQACDVFAQAIIVPAANAIEAPDTVEGQTLKWVATRYAESLSSPLKRILSVCPAQVCLALAADPALAGKIRFEFNPNLVNEIQGANLQEKEDNLTEDMVTNYEHAGAFILTDLEGNEFRFSSDAMKGHPTEQEKAFLEKFSNELIDYCLEKEKAAAEELPNQLQSRLAGLPEELHDCRELFEAAPASMLTISDKLDEFARTTVLKGTGDPDSNIVIGDRTGKELLKKEAEKRGLNADEMSGLERNVLLTAICASAMKEGTKVTMVGPDKASSFVKNLNNTLEVSELTMPEDLRNSRTASGLLKEMWEKIKGFFTKRSSAAEAEEEHQKLVGKVKGKAQNAYDRQYMMNHPSLRNASGLKATEVTASCNAASAMITSVLGGKAGSVKGYVFGDKSTLSRDTAILAIAYAMRGENERTDAPHLNAGERFTFAGSREEVQRQKIVLDNAAKKYAQILAKRRVNPAEADKELRNMVVQGLKEMGNSAEIAAIPNMIDYSVRYAADLSARRELINLTLVNKTPAGLGTTNGEKARPMSALLRGKASVSERDIAAMEYVNSAQTMEKVLNGENVVKNFDSLQNSVCRQSYYMRNLSQRPQRISYENIIPQTKPAWDYAEDYTKLSVTKINGNEDYTDKLRTALTEIKYIVSSDAQLLQRENEIPVVDREPAQQPGVPHN